MGEGRVEADHRIDEAGDIGAGAFAIGGIDRGIDALAMPRRQRSRQMAAGRKAEHADAALVDSEIDSPRADQPHRALGILQRHILPLRPAFAGQAIEQDEGGDALFVEPGGLARPLIVVGQEAIAPARHHQHRRAIGAGRAAHHQHRAGDPRHPAIGLGRVFRLVVDLADDPRARVAGRRAGP